MQDPRTTAGLGVSATRGVFWVGGGQFIRQGVQIVSMIILARLLMPEDFGLLGMALVFVGISQIFADFGVGAAIVQARYTDSRALSSAFWTNILAVLALMILLWFAAPYIAQFYGDERVQPIVMVLALSLFLTGLLVVPRALLYRELRFGEIVKSQILGSVLGMGVAIIMAWNGYGVWSLVAQPLVGSAVTAGMTLVYARWLPALSYSWTSVRGLVGFSAPVLGADLMNYAYRQGDSLVIGRVLGSQLLGYYALAQQIMLYPLSQISSVIVRVLFPALSRIQEDRGRVRQAYLKAVGAIALVTFPLMMGLFVLVDAFVLLVFGEKWMPMADVLKILCWVGLMQSISTTVGTIYLSMGRPRLAFYFTLFATPVFLCAFIIGVNWGIVGVAVAYGVATLIVSYANFVVAFRIIELGIAEFHATLIRPLLCAGIMMAVVWMMHHQVIAGETELTRVAVSVLSGMVVYALMSLLINRAQCLEILAMGRAALTRS